MPNDIKKLRRLMKAANVLKKNSMVRLRGANLNASQALKMAWWFEDFRTKLATGIYRFSYIKLDGSIREATGTLNPDLIPAENHPKNSGKTIPNYETFAYYDLDAAAWRSFRLDNFIGFIYEIDKEKSSKRENSR